MDNFETVYYAFLGELESGYSPPGVESVFSPGSECDQAYLQITAARDRLYARLGTEDDADVEAILSAQLDIQKTLCRKLFEYGLLQTRI